MGQFAYQYEFHWRLFRLHISIAVGKVEPAASESFQTVNSKDLKLGILETEIDDAFVHSWDPDPAEVAKLIDKHQLPPGREFPREVSEQMLRAHDGLKGFPEFKGPTEGGYDTRVFETLSGEKIQRKFTTFKTDAPLTSHDDLKSKLRKLIGDKGQKQLDDLDAIGELHFFQAERSHSPRQVKSEGRFEKFSGTPRLTQGR